MLADVVGEDSPQFVTCPAHGKSTATFVCVHLANATSSGLGIHYETSSTEPWPDLLCEDCAFDPDWNEANALDRIKLLCSRCWEQAFANNSGVQHGDPAGWLDEAMSRGERRQRRWTESYGILEARRYRYELEATPPWLGFGREGTRFDVLCDPVVIGSWSARSNTWLWGWANSWWSAELTRPVVRVKRAGEKLGIDRLWRSGFEGTEPMAWQVCLAALDLLPDFSGVYRSPTDSGALFLATRNTRRTV
jgi:hypothetical protein